MKSVRIVFVALLGLLLVLGACTGSAPVSSTAPSSTAGVEPPVSTPDAPVAAADPVAPKSSPGPAGAPAPIEAAVATVPPSVKTTLNTTTPSTGMSQFVVSDLKIAPNGVRLGELTTVTVNVTNIGNTTATYTAVLKVEPAWAQATVRILPQASQDVALAPGQSTTVTFQTGVMGNGAVIVSIEDQADRFIVDSQI